MIHGGQCHCGAIRFEVRLRDGLAGASRCTCSICRMRGAVVVPAEAEGFVVIRGAEFMTRYRFHSMVAEHFFCARCGIYTHRRRRSCPDEFGVNVACLDGVSPFDFPAVPVSDGALHPLDTGEPERWAGTLYFQPPIDLP